MKNNQKKIADIIEKNESFLICSHPHPDGDGIGSTLALGYALEKMGKKVVLYNEDAVPDMLDFLPFAEKIVRRVNSGDSFDVTIMVDCSQTERAGKDFPVKERRGILLAIDHHDIKSTVADECLIDTAASSTGEVVYNLLRELGAKVDTDIATLILTSIVVDTGFFKYSNTTSHTFSLAAKLLEAGAETSFVSRSLEERKDPAGLRLLSMAIDTIDYKYNGKLAIMVLTSQMFEEAGAALEMAEEFINFPRSVASVEIAALIREQEPLKYKISFRSKKSLDVAKLARQFDGGGHMHAAGCTLNGKLGEVKQQIVDAIGKALARISHSPCEKSGKTQIPSSKSQISSNNQKPKFQTL